MSTDLGGSSNYSHEMDTPFAKMACLALKTVVEEVSLPMAHRQGLVGPKCMVKFCKMEVFRHKREAGLRFPHLNRYLELRNDLVFIWGYA